MRVALIGYGRMGRTIEEILLERGHTISLRIDKDSPDNLGAISPENSDVAIEFTTPTTAFDNIATSIAAGVPVVSGTTGWLDRFDEVKQLVQDHSGAFFYASNFSLGVNIFFAVNKFLASLTEGRGYDSSIHEVHHIHKLDSPSGTAITLAEGVINNSNEKSGWTEGHTQDKSQLKISAERRGEVAGTHIVYHTSDVDTISIRHEANSRKGFAFGAVLVSEWIIGKEGMLDMDDYLNFKV